MPQPVQPIIVGIQTSKYPGSFGAVGTITPQNEPNIIGLQAEYFPGSEFLVASPAPIITTQPASTTGTPGNPLTLSIVAAPATSYQWFKNGVPIAIATSATFSIASYAAANAGSYTCQVTNTVAFNAPTSIISAVAVVS